jgi:hypothetical protein
VLALREIDESQGKLAGRYLARAGILVGLFLANVSVVFLSSQNPGGLDGLLRTMEWAGKLDYSTERKTTPAVERPSAAWGRVKDAADLLLYNVLEDAHLIFLSRDTGEAIKESSEQRRKALGYLRSSEAVAFLLGRMPKASKDERAAPPPPLEVPEFEENDDLKEVSGGWEEFTVDVVLRGQPRKLVVRYKVEDASLLIAAGAARQHRFEALET